MKTDGEYLDVQRIKVNADWYLVAIGGTGDMWLEKKVEHAKCYANIQVARFISRISIEFEDLPEQYWNILVPD